MSLDDKYGAWGVRLITGDEAGKTRKVKPENLQLVEDDRYVVNPKSGIVHIPLVWSTYVAPDLGVHGAVGVSACRQPFSRPMTGKLLSM